MMECKDMFIAVRSSWGHTIVLLSSEAPRETSMFEHADVPRANTTTKANTSTRILATVYHSPVSK